MRKRWTNSTGDWSLTSPHWLGMPEFNVAPSHVQIEQTQGQRIVRLHPISWTWPQQDKGLWVGPLICHLKLSNNNGNNNPSVRKAFASRNLKSLNRNDVIHHPLNFLVTKPEGICKITWKNLWQFWKHNEKVVGRGTHLSFKQGLEKRNELFNYCIKTIHEIARQSRSALDLIQGRFSY